MASHFKWYPSSEEVTVPWMAQYTFPSQANKSVKMTPRIPPKNGSTFSPGQVIRCEFPAQGYMNPSNTTYTFDVCLNGYATMNGEIIRFQNNINSLFTRVRLLYGATPLEDMINYNVIVRNLTEWTGTTQLHGIDNSSISAGIGGIFYVMSGTLVLAAATGFSTTANTSVRQAFIQGIDAQLPNIAPFNSATPGVAATNTRIAGRGTIPNQYQLTGAPNPGPAYSYANLDAFNVGLGAALPQCTRRYQLSLAFGLFTQGKLIPLKFMASQLAIEWTLASQQEPIFVVSNPATQNTTAPPTYTIGNFNMIPEILEFDASYDAMFLRGLREGGVPIKFSTWHTFIFSTNGATNLNLAVQERSRSVKALFTVQRRAPTTFYSDSHAGFFDSSAYVATVPVTGNTLQTYQYRIGGRYFPAAPVQTSVTLGSSISNGGCEAFTELEKALNVIGDYRLSPNISTLNWALQPATATFNNGSLTGSYYSEFDYCQSIFGYNAAGSPVLFPVTQAGLGSIVGIAGSSASGTLPSSSYASAICLETSNGMEISGLNAEEQSDISFLCNWSSAQQASFVIEVYTFIDAMIILRENNVLELIQ